MIAEEDPELAPLVFAAEEIKGEAAAAEVCSQEVAAQVEKTQEIIEEL